MKQFFTALASLVVVASTLFPQTAAAVGSNLIANPSLETSANGTAPDAWTNNKWGTNSSQFTYAATGHTGSKSIKTEITSYTSGDAKWSFNPVTVKPNTSYTFSDWYQSSAASSVDVVVTTSTNTTSYLWQGDLAASAAWKQANFTFKTPANASKVTVYHYLDKVGQVTLDDASLVENDAVPGPAVSISAPQASSTVSGNVTVTATATDAAGIKNVQFKLDGANLGAADTTAPYSTVWDTTKTTNGTHSLTAVATNMSSIATTSAPISVNVNNVVAPPTPPTVSLTAPAANATVSNTIAISANAGDAKGVTNVQFKLDGANLGAADTTAPYSVNWDTKTATNAAHSLTAVATNTSNLSTTSTAISVTVNNQVVVPPQPPQPPVVTNLISNPSIESGVTGWNNGAWGTNTNTMTVETTGRTGTKSLKAQISAYTNGDVKWFFNPVTVSGGKSYSYSNYYKSNVDSELDAMVTMSNGSIQWLYLTAAPASATDWQKASALFTVPAGAVSVSIFQVFGKVGYVQTDDYSLSEYTPAKFNRGMVSLTFDDGWRTIYTNGLPLLQKYNLPSTQYMLTETTDYPDYMTVAMMQAFKNQGSEIASHTISHSDLTTLTAAKLTTELSGSQASLRSWFGTAGVANNFATPFGAYNPNVITQIKKYYRSHRSTDVGFNSKDNFDIYNIKVQNITNTTTPAQVQAWINQAMTDKTWLVIVYHEVDANPADPTYAVTPANLNAELNIVKQSGISVQTVDSALNEILAQL